MGNRKSGHLVRGELMASRVDGDDLSNGSVVYGPFPCDSIGDLFYPTNATEAAVAKSTCRTCPYSEMCRANAVASQSTGIWGGEYYIDGEVSSQPFSGSRAVRTMTDEEAFDDDPFSLDYDLENE